MCIRDSFDPVCIGRIGADGRMYQIADTSLYHYSDRTSGNCGGGNICIYNVMELSLIHIFHEKEELHKRFEACYRDNLHSIWAGQELYRPGNSKEEFYNILQKNMQPVYDSARRQGYEIWSYS